MRYVTFSNPKLKGLPVRSRIAAETYVLDHLYPDTYRRKPVPEGSQGVLNGKIVVLLAQDETEELFRQLAAQSHELRELLIGQDAFEALRHSPVFLVSTVERKTYLASRLLLGVNWQHLDAKLEYAHLLPWLELVKN